MQKVEFEVFEPPRVHRSANLRGCACARTQIYSGDFDARGLGKRCTRKLKTMHTCEYKTQYILAVSRRTKNLCHIDLSLDLSYRAGNVLSSTGVRHIQRVIKFATKACRFQRCGEM